MKNPIIRLIGFSIFVLGILIPLGYLMFGSSSSWFWGSILVLILIVSFFWFKYRKKITRYRKRNMIVECLNCHRTMTYERYIESRGCPKCHTDVMRFVTKRN